MDRSLVLPEGAHVVSGPSFRFSQVSYATTDLDHACRTLGMTYGIPRFSVSRGARVESPAGTITIDVAQAFVGDRHIEIIEPTGGPDGLYRDVLPSSGFGVRHHHFGHVRTAPMSGSASRPLSRSADGRSCSPATIAT